ncbi:PTS transporter subunit EIIC [Lactiplantibacillus modestisalitolerans]|uniref:Permease IIC component n=1 Tax=Lactiplantibacillus modestisalitolerans TaxID=1457219 RepID=A0ABV5WWB2_9LACO|nr:PTS transporter subunit EIIC [Lactiplantibacillus modestisalitolerans]
MGSNEQRLIHWLIPRLLRLRQTNFYQIVQHTLMLTFPFILIGSFSQIIQLTVLTKTGFIASIFHLASWVPYYQYLHYPFDNLTALTLNAVAVIAAFGAAKYHAHIHHRDEQLAGLTAALALLVIAYQYTDQVQLGIFDPTLIGTNGFTGALLIGGATGTCFKWLSRPVKRTQPATGGDILARTFGSLLPMLVVLVVALLIGLSWQWFVLVTSSHDVWLGLQKWAWASHSIGVTFLMALLTLVLEIMGFAGPYQQRLVANSPSMTANLNYALTHHSAYHVPYPYTADTLYHAFGTFGGTGMLLALVIAIFIGSNQHNRHVVARWGLVPTLFNSNGPILTGLPVLYNPIYLIPFVLAPLVNMGIAALAFAWDWLPPVVYPVPTGTPGPLIAFIGTNGNVVALLLGIADLALSVLIYWPFMRLSEQLSVAADQQSFKRQSVEGGVTHAD